MNQAPAISKSAATRFHPTAVIAQGAKIADSAEVGPFCVVGAQVTLGEHVQLHSHVSIAGRTEIGESTQVFPFASIGHAPQDLKYKGEPSRLVIGHHTIIREQVTINPGTEGGGMLTRIGNHCLFMVGVHVAHDCIIGDHVIMANNATLAGHVEVGDYTVIGGLAAVHQYVRIGKHVIIGGLAGVEHDVIPYGSIVGERARLSGLNLVGLKRRGFDRETIHALRNAYKMLFESDEDTLALRTARAQELYQAVEPVRDILAFMEDKGSRSLSMPRLRQPASSDV